MDVQSKVIAILTIIACSTVTQYAVEALSIDTLVMGLLKALLPLLSSLVKWFTPITMDVTKELTDLIGDICPVIDQLRSVISALGI